MIITVFFFILVGLFFDCHMAFRVATNGQGLWSGGGFGTRPPERLLINY